MADETPNQEETPKKRGWPKGKPRGPRKPVEAPQTPVQAPPLPPPAPPAPTPPEPTPVFDPSEVVSVKAKLVNGASLAFRAMRFDVENGRYSFTSYPPMRGFKTVTYLRNDQLAMLEITAPEDMMEKLKAAPAEAPIFVPSAASLPAGTPQGPPIVYGPNSTMVRPPYDGGDPRRAAVDFKAEQARRVEGVGRRPYAAEISKGDDGTPEVIGATMQGT